MDNSRFINYHARFVCGAIAQLGERNTGSVEVGGSIPPGSTKQDQENPDLASAGFFFENHLRPVHLEA